MLEPHGSLPTEQDKVMKGPWAKSLQVFFYSANTKLAEEEDIEKAKAKNKLTANAVSFSPEKWYPRLKQ